MKREENTNKALPCERYNEMARLWLAVSVEAYGFIPREYWEGNPEAMPACFRRKPENR